MPEPDDFNPDDVTAVLTALRTATPAIRADTDPGRITAPGVWLRFDGLNHDHLHGLTLRTTLHLVVGENEQPRVLAALADLFNRVKAVLTGLQLEPPTFTLIGLVLPGSQTPLPCLAGPLDIPTCQTT